VTVVVTVSHVLLWPYTAINGPYGAQILINALKKCSIPRRMKVKCLDNEEDSIGQRNSFPSPKDDKFHLGCVPRSRKTSHLMSLPVPTVPAPFCTKPDTPHHHLPGPSRIPRQTIPTYHTNPSFSGCSQGMVIAPTETHVIILDRHEFIC